MGPERTTHGRETESFEDFLALVYSATSVNAVLISDLGEPYKVRITVDGEYLTEKTKAQASSLETTVKAISGSRLPASIM